MKLRTAILILLASAGATFADPMIENAQQALKDQGFYYGEITGNKDRYAFYVNGSGAISY